MAGEMGIAILSDVLVHSYLLLPILGIHTYTTRMFTLQGTAVICLHQVVPRKASTSQFLTPQWIPKPDSLTLVPVAAWKRELGHKA